MSRVRVWDLPTRVFHWSLALCFVGLLITGEIAGNAMPWHFRFGYAVLTLVLFRLVWGFFGGYWSRFSSFVVTPRTFLTYWSQGANRPESVGHNPLGAISVLALLAVALVQACAGLMSDDEILASGPLVGKVPAAWVGVATFFHTEIGKLVLIALVVLHILAIAWYRLKRGKDLVRPMVSGDKDIAGVHPHSRDDWMSGLAALGVLVLCSLAVAGLVRWGG